MAIISFWSGEDKQSAQTLSMVAVATYMAIEHNYRILMIDATFQDDTLERCFWNINPVKKSLASDLNAGKIDIASGAEGLLSAVISNRTTPEIIPNYTRVVLKNRLDILCGLKTDNPQEFEKSLSHYPQLLSVANKYYDFVFIDLPKTLKDKTTRILLESSTIIAYTFIQNLRMIDSYRDKLQKQDLLKKGNIIPILTNADEKSKYNVKNTSRYIGSRKELASIQHNANFMESACEAAVANFFLKTRLATTPQDKNSEFIKSVGSVSKQILEKIEELKYKS